MKSITFKPLTENDLLLLYDWFQKPHILTWYARGKHYSLTKIKEKYEHRIKDPTIPSFIIHIENQPIGYIQLYEVSHHLPDGVSDYDHPLFQQNKPNEVAGIDLFIADEKYLNKGYAGTILKIFINEHVKTKFTVLVADPLKANSHAIRFFEHNGFKKLVCDLLSNVNELLVLYVK